MLDLLKKNALPAKIALSAGIVVLLAMRMNLSEFGKIIGEIHIWSWGAALALIFLQILFLSYRWSLLLNVNSKKVEYTDSLRIVLVSFLANYLFITSIGGVVVRISMAMQEGVSLVKALAATALDRLLTMVALLVLSVVFLPILWTLVEGDIFNSMLAVIATFLGALAVFPFLFFRNIRKNLIFSNRKIAICFKYLSRIARDQNLIAGLTVSSLLGQLCYFSAVYVLIVSSGENFSFSSLMAILPMITLAASLPVGYGGWGIREGAFVYGLGLIHLPIETAFLVSVQIGIISMAAAIIAGIPALLNKKTHFSFRGWSLSGISSKKKAHVSAH